MSKNYNFKFNNSMSDIQKQGTLKLPNGKIINLPYKEATIGQDVLDISKLLKEVGVFTFDPGFMSTSSCESKITYIDGEKGILRYRGYGIEELAEKSNYLEICYLLLKGELPNDQEYQDFSKKMVENSAINESFYNFYQSFPQNTHPMAILGASNNLITGFYHNSTKQLSEEERFDVSCKIIAKLPTLAAFAYKNSINEDFIQPDPNLNFIENILYMFFAKKDQPYKANKIAIEAMNKILILHADHEQNASTSTVRIAASSATDPFSAISAGIASLWGPSHGGANEAVLNMLEKIGSVDNIPKFIAKAKDKNDPFRLMGFGHRVYKNYDPRAKVLKKSCDEILKEFHDENNQLLQIAAELEKIALNDSYFIERKLFPNVDFYSGIIYKALGIPNNFFTVIFAISRVSGWVSQLNESLTDANFKISRPRQLYLGEVNRRYDQ
jgi:citrate synthase